ncbi:MAG: hypothetical protein ACKVQA_23515 [Burkholderiales bacterium]
MIRKAVGLSTAAFGGAALGKSMVCARTDTENSRNHGRVAKVGLATASIWQDWIRTISHVTARVGHEAQRQQQRRASASRLSRTVPGGQSGGAEL